MPSSRIIAEHVAADGCPVLAAEIAAVLAVPCLRTLTLSRTGMDAVKLVPVLQSEHVRASLRRVDLWRHVDAATLALLAQLPHLCTLSLLHTLEESDVFVAAFERVVRLPTLTALRLSGRSKLLHDLLACLATHGVALRRLYVGNTSVTADTWMPLLGRGLLAANLQYLALGHRTFSRGFFDHYHRNPALVATDDRVLPSLPALTALHVAEADWLGEPLLCKRLQGAAVHGELPALRALHLTPETHFLAAGGTGQQASLGPRALSALLGLRQEIPSLRISVMQNGVPDSVMRSALTKAGPVLASGVAWLRADGGDRVPPELRLDTRLDAQVGNCQPYMHGPSLLDPHPCAIL